MRSLIICEGIDDLYILGHYLNKTEKWQPVLKSELPYGENYPANLKDNQKINSFEKLGNYLDIFAVGGDSRIGVAFDFLKVTNENNPEFLISQVFIVMDKDDDSVEKRLRQIEKTAKKKDLAIELLKNNQINKFTLSTVEKYELSVIPIVIPFDENGALETLLLTSIAGGDTEDKLVVELANKHIAAFLESGQQYKYLKQRRLVTKAKLASAISITHPDRAGVVRELLTSHNWENHSKIRDHFKMLNELL